MPLSAGDKLGPYEILALVGKGGMGEVYRAHDSRLNRDVAIKVSNAQFTERFTREARAIAALNHTNICHLYDVGPNYLVMEYVEGQDLHGPLDFDDALPIVEQLIDGIEAAHEKNIVHRDLKPANIKITPEGVVKILDFGLAKAMEPPPSEDGNPENSPTLTLGATQTGAILGTAAYMAPEQAKGKAADKRSDIWSFGVVLYEVLTGQRLFQGESTVEILGGVLNKEPDLSAAPQRVHKLLRWCLEKDRKQRLASISDARRLLEDVGQVHGLSTTGHGPVPQRWPWVAAGALAVLAAVLAVVHFRETPPKQQSYRFQIAPPPNTRFTTFRLSPDGRYVAFIATGGQSGGAGQGGLWIRALDSLESRQVAGTGGASYPFWSPDSAFVGFFEGGKLKKVAVTGGPSQTICDVTASRGGAWGPDGTILFTDGPARPLFRVPSSGGKPVQLTKLSGGDPGEGHRAPEFLPDGRHFLFLANGNKPEATGLQVGSLDGGAPVRLLSDNANGVYLPGTGPRAEGGYLFFLREGTLMALPFDAALLKVTAEAFPVAENVALAANQVYGAFSAAGNSTLAYWGGGAADNRELVWMDRAGRRLAVLGKPNAFAPYQMALSPDEKTVAVGVGANPQTDIWLLDLARGTMTRFTFGFKGVDPVWSPDGRSLVYSRPNGFANDIVRRPIAGGAEELLLSNIVNALPGDVSSDGKFIVHGRNVAKTGSDIGLLSADGDHRESVYLGTPANEMRARFSPDGKWMAYQSDDSGQFQVYVQTIPVGGGKFQISTSGGTLPAWRRDGKELYYLSPDQKIMAVPVKINGASFEPGTPQALFTATGASSFAVTRDGLRFLVNVPAGGESAAAGPPLTIVTNWSPSSPQGPH